jgi:hypothetical protein
MVDKNLMFDEGEMLISILDYKRWKTLQNFKNKNLL